MHHPKIACIIPARLASRRFPRKILAPLAGKPLIQWVWEAATKTNRFDDVVLAIESQETADIVTQFSARFLMTSPHCASGTDRLVEIMQSNIIEADIWVNWQGDDPFVTPQMIDTLLSTYHENDADVWTLKKRISQKEDIHSPHIVKVVCDQQQQALYFSRAPIPFWQPNTHRKKPTYYKHIGIYAYTKHALTRIASMHPADLEKVEALEQLRFLYHGLRIKVHETSHHAIDINIPEDLDRAENFVRFNQQTLNGIV